MDWIILVFGEGKELTIWQMIARACVIFLIALGLIRLAGRRSFGIHAAFDNTIIILLGAILSRPVVGASPFFPTIFACLVISALHRVFALISVNCKWFETITKGKKIILFDNGIFIHKNLKRALVSEEDVLSTMRMGLLHNPNLGLFQRAVAKLRRVSPVCKDARSVAEQIRQSYNRSSN